ncbi:acylglycerol kinase, mitochondrial [Euwallacea fornicatus]|uniref:acylglycerol kinase, mitochondrial n=1 Tax=Euwallacea fornicatus TaxID=995702 RepID=UPI00338EBAEE
MSFVIKTARTVRNNWKKSAFLTVVVAWSGSYTKNYFDTQSLMRIYCERAALYGQQTIPVTVNSRRITVILNPNANKRKAETEFEKYCAPLLHLAGINVEIVKTNSEGHARSLMESLNGAEAIVVAGGDGTLSEVVTGLLRRTNENANALVPIGVLPLGKNNTVGKSLFPGETKLEKVTSLANATMAVIEEISKQIDVMRIEILNNEDKKPVYAISDIKWGAYRDAEVKKDHYWVFGKLRKYATYIFNGFKSSLSWNCQAHLLYSPPCSGCSNCYKMQNVQPKSKWFQSYIKEDQDTLKYKQINNPHCNQMVERDITTSDFTLLTSNIISNKITDVSKLNIFIGPEKIEYFNFIRQGWKTERGECREFKEAIEARTLEIQPQIKPEKESWFSIDNEEYEVKPVKITLLPKLLKMYCKKDTL